MGKVRTLRINVHTGEQEVKKGLRWVKAGGTGEVNVQKFKRWQDMRKERDRKKDKKEEEVR